ncbi:MAG: hypothetical protein AAFW70_11310 [Cyanobacteria bacterium J06635_10]
MPSNFDDFIHDPAFLDITEKVKNRGLRSRLSYNSLSEIYQSDNFIAKLVENLSHYLSSFPWQLKTTNNSLAAEVREYLESISLMRFLGKAYKFASIYDISYLVLAQDSDAALRIEDVVHLGNRYDTDVTNYYRFTPSFYPSNNREIFAFDGQLLEMGSSDFIGKYYWHYDRYLEALEDAKLLASRADFTTAFLEDLETLVNVTTLEEQQQHLNNIKESLDNAKITGGSAIFSGKGRIENHGRDSSEAIKIIEPCKEAFIAATGLPEFFVMGKVSAGGGFGNSSDLEKNTITNLVRSRRQIYFTPVVNFIIDRYLITTGRIPGTVLIDWDVTSPVSGKEQSEIELNKARKHEIEVKSNILYPEEIRETYYQKSGEEEVSIEDSVFESTPLPSSLARKIWSEFQSKNNMSFNDSIRWRDCRGIEDSPQDKMLFSKYLILKCASEEEFYRREELQDWAYQINKRIRYLQSLNPSKTRDSCLRTLGTEVTKHRKTISPEQIEAEKRLRLKQDETQEFFKNLN